MLTEREVEILRLLADGLTNHQVAERLFLAYNTVKWYNQQIYSKLGATNREEALILAAEYNLLPKRVIEPKHKPHNLPTPITKFIGRDLEIAQIRQLLGDEDIRLITVVAPGGMGKSRLALEIADLITKQGTVFVDGVYFVPLAARNSSNMIGTIIEQIGYQLISDDHDLYQQLLDFLSDKEILLILDNFEHLLDTVMPIDDILRVAPQTKILVTSREVLKLSSETIVKLAGITFPEMQSSKDLVEYSAVQLFLNSAQRADVSFYPDDHDVQQIARICQLVEGMPLAIILAATWIRTLSSQEIADEIRDSLDLLAADLSDIPIRQQSVRAVIEQSWKMLTDAQKHALVGLSIFHDGCTRPAAQAVVAVKLTTLKALVDKSMISRSAEGRYTMHELLRQFARERLTQFEGAQQLQSKHARYYLEMLHQQEKDLKSSRQLAAVHEIAQDFQNIQHAWAWSIDHRELGLLANAVEPLTIYATMKPNSYEICDMLSNLIYEVGNEDPWLTDLAFVRKCSLERADESMIIPLGNLLQVALSRKDELETAYIMLVLADVSGHAIGDTEKAVDMTRESLNLYRKMGDQYGILIALDRFAYWLTANQNHDESVQVVQQWVEVSRKLGATHTQARATRYLATILANRFGQFDESAHYHREAIDLFEQLGAIPDLVDTITGLAFWYNLLHQGDIAATRHKLDDASIMLGRLGDLIIISYITIVRGVMAGIQEDYERAEALLKEGRQQSHNEKYRTLIADCGLALVYVGLDNLQEATECVDSVLSFFLPNFRYFVIAIAGCICAKSGKLEDAAALMAFIQSSQINAKGWLREWQPFTNLHNYVQAGLAPDVYSAACKRGESFTLEAVVEAWQSSETHPPAILSSIP